MGASPRGSTSWNRCRWARGGEQGPRGRGSTPFSTPLSLLEQEKPKAMDNKEEPRAPVEVVQSFRCQFPRKIGIGRSWSLAALGSVTQIELQLAFPHLCPIKVHEVGKVGPQAHRDTLSMTFTDL